VYELVESMDLESESICG